MCNAAIKLQSLVVVQSHTKCEHGPKTRGSAGLGHHEKPRPMAIVHSVLITAVNSLRIANILIH
jgi:hypothetical protein